MKIFGIIAALMLLVSCKTTFVGGVTLAPGVFGIDLINEESQTVSLTSGPTTIEAWRSGFTVVIDGVKEEFDLPFGIRFKQNFYYEADEIGQPVDVAGKTNITEGEEFTVREWRRCNRSGCTHGTRCEGQQAWDVTYRDDTHFLDLSFHDPGVTSPLGKFQEEQGRVYRREVDSRRVGFCN